MLDGRFTKSECLVTSFEEFTEFMQENFDDSSLILEEEYSALEMYSEGYDCGYDEGEILKRVSFWLGLETDITSCYLDKECRMIHFFM
jgi:hypothetical protein